MPIILDHTIVGQELTTLSIRKDREFAACRICGVVFQSELATDLPDHMYDGTAVYMVAAETRYWRMQHNKLHPERVHLAFRASGLTFTPEAAQRLAPYGLVSLDASDEVAQAMLEAPRAPLVDVESSLKRGR